ncbi:MAG: hypothetical protein KME22_21295 [Hassallia sp. WJT32-NPBG1]|nr:hypothetical protein [Hassallia sp. WJT32-NPBG1]
MTKFSQTRTNSDYDHQLLSVFFIKDFIGDRPFWLTDFHLTEKNEPERSLFL